MLFDSLFTTEPMRATFSDARRIQGMLNFEAALARAEARVGMIPPEAAEAIAARCQVERFDLSEIARATAKAGNPAIPLIAVLTEQVASENAEAARYVHWGATSQDAMDTGLMLQLRDALDTLDGDLARLARACATLAEATAGTPMAGRTWLQQASPTTFGLKVAGWLSAINRHRQRLRRLRPRVLVVQLGGSVGTLAGFGALGIEVAAALADDMGLALPDIPWHAERDRVAEVATTLGLLAGTLGKMARDTSLLAQTEVGEAFEPDEPGKGRSSTLPQKRNPVGASVALAAATRVPGLVATMLAAMPQEHERGLGGWQAEWETLPEVACLTAGALAQMTQVVESMELDSDRMRANLDLTHGVICAEAVALALALSVGKSEAHRLVREASHRALTQQTPLREALAAMPEVTARLSGDDLDRLCDPASVTGPAERLIQRVLAQEMD
jgi:3-carboxy-cis,cis-muconate cycloisomerase